MKTIIFHPTLMPGLLAGRITETRRVIKVPPGSRLLGFDGAAARFETEAGEAVYRPRFQPGERVRVKEVWATAPDIALPPSAIQPGTVVVLYRSGDNGEPVRWRSPLFMPGWMSRAVIRVVAVNVQPVQSVTPAQAVASGINPHAVEPLRFYRELWDELNAGRGFGWTINPWAWVYEFELENGHLS